MGLRDSLRRPDWLRELQVVLVLAGIFVAGGLVVGAIEAIFGDQVAFAVPAARAVEITGGVEPGVVLASNGLVDLAIDGPSGSQRALALLATVPSYLLVLTMIVLLWRAVRAARRKGAFADAMGRRMTMLGFVTVAGGTVVDLVQSLAALFGSSTMLVDSFAGQYSYSWWWFLTGFGFFAVGQVLRSGAAIRAELDEVV